MPGISIFRPYISLTDDKIFYWGFIVDGSYFIAGKTAANTNDNYFCEDITFTKNNWNITNLSSNR